MDGEGLFDADTVGHTANGKGLLDAAMLLGNDSTLEDLDTLTGAFLDAVVNLDGVTDVEVVSAFLQLTVGQMLDQIHVDSFLSIIDVHAQK